MKKLVLKLKNNWKKTFCFCLVLGSILFLLILLIKQPMKKNTNYVYNTGIESEIIEVQFPLKQYIKVNSDYLTTFTIYLQDDSINQYDYQIELKDKDGKVYFQNHYIHYESNIIILDLGVVPDSSNQEFELNITCEECEGVKASIRESNDDSTYIEGTKNQSLELSYDNYSKNNTYYWYPLMAVFIAFTLYPLAKEEKHEYRKK